MAASFTGYVPWIFPFLVFIRWLIFYFIRLNNPTVLVVVVFIIRWIEYSHCDLP